MWEMSTRAQGVDAAKRSADAANAGADAASLPFPKLALPHVASAPKSRCGCSRLASRCIRTGVGRASFAFSRALTIIAQYLALDLEVNVLRALVLACLALDGLGLAV